MCCVCLFAATTVSIREVTAVIVSDLARDKGVGFGYLCVSSATCLESCACLANLNRTHHYVTHSCIMPTETQETGGRLPLIVDATAPTTGGGLFRSLQQAVDQAQPGDTILVKKGTYHETVTVDKKGITIAAFDPSRPPVIDGADQSLGRLNWEHVQGKVYRARYAWYKSQLTAAEFDRYGGGKSPHHIAMQVYEDSILLRGYVGSFTDYHNWGYGAPYTRISQLDPTSTSFYPDSTMKPDIRIPGRFLYDEVNEDLYVWSAASDNPDSHEYSIPVLENLLVLKAPEVTIRNLVLQYSAGYAVVVEDGADAAQVLDCFLVNDMYAVYVKHANDVLIARNFIQQRGMWERYWYYDCKNTVLWAHSIDLYEEDHNRRTEICGNVIHGNYSAMYVCSNTEIHDNILSHCMSTHINVEPTSTDVYVYGNAFHHIDDNSIGVSQQQGGPIWVFRNLFYDCRALNKAGANTRDAAQGRCYFYQNTFALGAMVAHHPYDYPVYGNHVYRNNIFHLAYRGTFEQYWSYTRKAPSLDWDFFPFENGPDADYNLYWEVNPRDGNEGIAHFCYEGGAHTQYAFEEFDRMQKETGLDPHGWQADPVFRGKLALEDPNVEVLPYDMLSLMDYIEILPEDLTYWLGLQFHRFFNLFGVEAASPAVESGIQLPAEWPDVTQARPAHPSLGAWEVHAQTSGAEAMLHNEPTSYGNGIGRSSASKPSLTTRLSRNLNAPAASQATQSQVEVCTPLKP